MKNDFISGIIAYHISRFEGRSTNFKSRKKCFNSEFIVRVPENTRSISVLDEGGREVYRQHVDSQARLVTVDASAWAPGTYFIRVVGKHEITVVKGVKR